MTASFCQPTVNIFVPSSLKVTSCGVAAGELVEKLPVEDAVEISKAVDNENSYIFLSLPLLINILDPLLLKVTSLGLVIEVSKRSSSPA